MAAGFANGDVWIMPQAPGLLPDVAPSTGGVPDVQLPVPVDAFGGAVGHALQGLGTDIEQGSDRIWQRAVDLQNLNNETAAKDADAQYMIKSGQLHADFLNKEGLNAGPEALQQHIQDLQNLRTQIRSTLNPMAAKMYDASSLSFMGRNIFNAAGHSGQQMKVAANNASNSRIELATTQMGDNPTDPIAVGRARRVVETEVQAQGRLNGWSDDQTAATTQFKLSAATAHQIVGIARTNAIGAQTALTAAIKSKQITPEDAEKVQGTVTTQLYDQGSRVVADKVLANRRDGTDGEDEKTEDDYVKEGLDEAAKYNIPDEVKQGFADRVRDRIITQYKKQKMIETDTANQNVTVIGKALLNTNAEGMRPTSIEELKAIDPAVGPAWDALGGRPKVQQQILNQLQRNAAGPRTPITSENLSLFHAYKGMALSADDDTRAGFMAQNFAADARLANSQKNELMNIQDQMRKQSYEDPRVARAMRILGPDMSAAGISRKNNSDDYYQFMGSLQDALGQFQTDHPGKVPSLDEVRTIGSQIMQEQHQHFWQSHEAFYEMTAPDDIREKMRADPAWAAKGIRPTDSMIDRIYRAQLYRQRFGGTAPKTEAQFPPNEPTE